MDQEGSDTVEWHLAFGQYGVTELGYAFLPELARDLVDLFRYQEPDFAADAALLEAGFLEEKDQRGSLGATGKHAVRYFTKKMGRNTLELRQDAYGCKLEYHRYGSHRWLNLYAIHVVKAAYNGNVYPLVWPAVIANPSAAALAGALKAAHAFENQERARIEARQLKKAKKSLSKTQD